MNKYFKWDHKSVFRFFIFLMVIALTIILVQLSSGIDQLASSTFVSSQSVKSELAVSELPTFTEVPPTMTGEALPFYTDLTPEFPEITFIAPATGVPLAPIPTSTPLPTVDPNNHSPYASQNLVLHELPTPVSEMLQENASRPLQDGSWSPDGQFFAATVATAKIEVNVLTPSKIVLFDASGQVVKDLAVGREPVWSPNGQFIAYQEWSNEAKLGHLRIVEVASQRVTDVAEMTASHSRPIITWISDTEILFSKELWDYAKGVLLKGELLVFDLNSGASSPLLDQKTYQSFIEGQIGPSLHIVSALPQSGLIAVNSSTIGAIFKRSQGGMQRIRSLEGTDGIPTISPDGTLVAYLSDSSHLVKIISVADETIQPIEVNSGYTENLAWSPDSSSLVYTNRSGINIINRDGSGLRLLFSYEKGEISEVARVSWSSKGIFTVTRGNGNVRYYSADIQQ